MQSAQPIANASKGMSPLAPLGLYVLLDVYSRNKKRQGLGRQELGMSSADQSEVNCKVFCHLLPVELSCDLHSGCLCLRLQSAHKPHKLSRYLNLCR